MVTKFLPVGFCVALSAVGSVVRADEVSGSNDCQSHFTTEGNLLTGKKYSTWVLISSATNADVYARVYSSVAKDGWSIVNADKDAGIISAVQGVSYGKGSQSPLMIVVEEAGKGSRVSMTFRTGGAQMVREETIRLKLCAYLKSAVSP